MQFRNKAAMKISSLIPTFNLFSYIFTKSSGGIWQDALLQVHFANTWVKQDQNQPPRFKSAYIRIDLLYWLLHYVSKKVQHTWLFRKEATKKSETISLPSSNAPLVLLLLTPEDDHPLSTIDNIIQSDYIHPQLLEVRGWIRAWMSLVGFYETKCSRIKIHQLL